LPWTSSRNGTRGASRVIAAAATIDWFAVLRAKGDPASTHEQALKLARDFDAGQDSCLRRFDLPREATDDAPAPDKDALLVFVHGAFMYADDTFAGLLKKPTQPCVSDISRRYRSENVLAFEHPTLMASPIANAFHLAAALPAHAKLDLVTHARGGLIAEILVRAGRTDDAQEFGRRSDDDTGKETGADLAAEREMLQALAKMLREKAITVRRVVRVACPARGTLLASRRLDAWMSVLQWQARISGVKLTVHWLELLCEIARAGLLPEDLPGLGAMLPESHLVRWLNAPASRVDSELFVVTGDSRGDGLLTWLQTLMADAFFWTDNDLVVQTRSMVGGVPRAPGVTAPKFIEAKADRITHFTYFEQHDVVSAMADALKGKPGKEWKTIGPLSWSGRDASGKRDKDVAPVRADPSRPTVVLIPNVFGSVLTDTSGRKLWLNEKSVAAFARLAMQAGDAENEEEASQPPRVVATRLLRGYYGDLHEHFARTHNVIDFPYDWRLGFAVLAARLEQRIGQLLQSADVGEHPLRIVAHGMGALLVRAWHARHRGSWSRLMARPGSRVMLLGPPNSGFWLPLRLFSGDDAFGTLFASAGTLAHEREVRRILADMPGLVQLQAGLSGQADQLHGQAHWEQFEQNEYGSARGGDKWHGGSGSAGHMDSWAIPGEKRLDEACEFWRGLERALPALLRDRDRIVVVAGTGHATVTGIRHADDELYFATT
ncbi:MAG TPA: hypothetical protein VF774_17185, partial [Pseudoduganella sp.]